MAETRPLDDVIMEVARTGLTLQDDAGRMPPGSNGPWNHRETPVRATAHWSVLFLAVHRLTGSTKYADAAERSLQYLHSTEARPHFLTFFCRHSGGKDRANNVIGQAWAMEALLEDEADDLVQGSYSLAVEVGRMLPYDSRANLWHRVEIDGSMSAPCWTLNQHVMLSAVMLRAGRVAGAADLAERAKRFLVGLPHQIRPAENDLPHHHLMPLNGRGSAVLASVTWRLNRRRWMAQSKGYLSFILYALGCARLWAPKVQCLTEGPLPRLVRSWIRRITDDMPFGHGEDPASFRWAYNPTGFEVALAISAFAPDDDELVTVARELIGLQTGYLRPGTRLPSREVTCDPVTLIARTYEATRLPLGWMRASESNGYDAAPPS